MAKKFLDNTGLSHLIDLIQSMPDDQTIGYTTEAGLHVLDGSITTNKLANGAVTTDKIAEGGITGDNIADGSITSTQINSEYTNAITSQIKSSGGWGASDPAVRVGYTNVKSVKPTFTNTFANDYLNFNGPWMMSKKGIENIWINPTLYYDMFGPSSSSISSYNNGYAPSCWWNHVSKSLFYLKFNSNSGIAVKFNNDGSFSEINLGTNLGSGNNTLRSVGVFFDDNGSISIYTFRLETKYRIRKIIISSDNVVSVNTIYETDPATGIFTPMGHVKYGFSFYEPRIPMTQDINGNKYWFSSVNISNNHYCYHCFRIESDDVVNEVAEDHSLKYTSATTYPYFSYPISTGDSVIILCEGKSTNYEQVNATKIQYNSNGVASYDQVSTSSSKDDPIWFNSTNDVLSMPKVMRTKLPCGNNTIKKDGHIPTVLTTLYDTECNPVSYATIAQDPTTKDSNISILGSTNIVPISKSSWTSNGGSWSPDIICGDYELLGISSNTLNINDIKSSNAVVAMTSPYGICGVRKGSAATSNPPMYINANDKQTWPLYCDSSDYRRSLPIYYAASGVYDVNTNFSWSILNASSFLIGELSY